MRDDEYDTTIGTGGWLLVGLSGVVVFTVLRGLLDYHLFPSVVFAMAVALVVLLVLYRLAAAVNRYDKEEEAQRVRKIVPASGEAGMRASGAEGAAGAVAVPVRPEVVTPQRPSSVVTPLANVEPAPILAPQPMAAAPMVAEPAAVMAKPKAEKPAAKPKAEKPAAKPKAEKPAAKPKAEPKPKAKAEATEKPAKAAAKPKAKAEKPGGLVRLTAPRKGVADDLKEIEGIGPALEKTINAMGFYHFDQIAAWTEADIAQVDGEMKTFKGRITRDRWVEQARIIVNEGLEAFRERAKTNNY
jgi:predicted flap endonuclease-1-like 5' DNA nuclease